MHTKDWKDTNDNPPSSFGWTNSKETLFNIQSLKCLSFDKNITFRHFIIPTAKYFTIDTISNLYFGVVW